MSANRTVAAARGKAVGCRSGERQGCDVVCVCVCEGEGRKFWFWSEDYSSFGKKRNVQISFTPIPLTMM